MEFEAILSNGKHMKKFGQINLKISGRSPAQETLFSQD
jgi:hypothetical protein